MEYATDIEVRFADLDAYQHVNNATYFTYLETARIKLFREKFTDQLKSGLLFLVAEASCRYLQPIALNDRVVIRLRCDKVGRSSFTLGYRITDDGERLFAEAQTVMVCFDAAKQTPVAIPDDLRLALTGV